MNSATPPLTVVLEMIQLLFRKDDKGYPMTSLVQGNGWLQGHADSSGRIGVHVNFTMDYADLEREFPRGVRIVCLKPMFTSLSWGQVFTVTGYSPISPGLELKGQSLSYDGGIFQRLEDFPLCPHNTHIIGGDCPQCAIQKRLTLIDARKAYSFKNDPAYAQLSQESKRLKFESFTETYLKVMEGDGHLRFAERAAAREYVKTLAGVDTYTTVYEVPDFIAMETEKAMPYDSIVATLTQNTGAQPQHKQFGHEQLWLWTVGDNKWIELAMDYPERPLKIRLHNSRHQLYNFDLKN